MSNHIPKQGESYNRKGYFSNRRNTVSTYGERMAFSHGAFWRKTCSELRVIEAPRRMTR